jgi:hypothetical protein
MKKNVNLKFSPRLIGRKLLALKKYSSIAFLLLVIGIYGFIVYRIHLIGNEQPANTVISTQVKGSHVPQVDQAIVKKLETLQDNSVNVQTLFEQARNNPFE